MPAPARRHALVRVAHEVRSSIVNDVTSRTVQNAHKQWFLGKSMDGFCPMGPAVVTADEVPNPAALRLRTEVNGELRQDAQVSDLIFDIPTLIDVVFVGHEPSDGDLLRLDPAAGIVEKVAS